MLHYELHKCRLILVLARLWSIQANRGCGGLKGKNPSQSHSGISPCPLGLPCFPPPIPPLLVPAHAVCPRGEGRDGLTCLADNLATAARLLLLSQLSPPQRLAVVVGVEWQPGRQVNTSLPASLEQTAQVATHLGYWGEPGRAGR